jgi:hypothetical protein
MSVVAYVLGWMLLAVLVACSAVVLPPLLVAGSWFAGWLEEHHRHA